MNCKTCLHRYERPKRSPQEKLVVECRRYPPEVDPNRQETRALFPVVYVEHTSEGRGDNNFCWEYRNDFKSEKLDLAEVMKEPGTIVPLEEKKSRGRPKKAS